MASNPTQTLEWGRYPFYADGTIEPIEWIVLEEKGHKLLLISKYGLDRRQYNTSLDNATWEMSSIRKWLNSEFLRNAFTANELKIISETRVTADKNPKYDTDPGNNTVDKVFLLSCKEVLQYFKSNKSRLCEATDYAVKQGAFKSNETGGCWWWLRSPGRVSQSAAGINTDGSVNERGGGVEGGNNAVRPALWVKLRDN